MLGSLRGVSCAKRNQLLPSASARLNRGIASRRGRLDSPLRGVQCAACRKLSTSAAASLATRLNGDLALMREAGTFKVERVITSPMEPAMRVAGSDAAVLNFCANNYLGFSNHPRLVEAAGRYLKRREQTRYWQSQPAQPRFPAGARLPPAALTAPFFPPQPRPGRLVCPFHLRDARHPQATRGSRQRVPPHRRHHPLPVSQAKDSRARVPVLPEPYK
jgi:hypothetical protein